MHVSEAYKRLHVHSVVVGEFGDMTAFLDGIWQAGLKEAFGATHDANFPCMTNSYTFGAPAPGLSPVNTY